MNFLTDDIRKLYRKMLIPSLTGAVVMSIYSFVDTIAVGQSEGTAGAAFSYFYAAVPYYSANWRCIVPIASIMFR